MKKYFFKFLSLFILLNNTYSLEHFSVSNLINLGIKHSSVTETVFDNGNKISELIWKSVVLPEISNEFIIKLYNFNIDMGFLSIIPVNSGNMEDKDFLFSDRTLLSNFSKHDLFIDKDYSLWSKVYYDFVLCSEKIKISPQLGILYKNAKYSAKDGFYQYSFSENQPVSDDTKKEFLRGMVICYETSAIMPIVSLRLIVNFYKRNSINFEIDYSPIFFIDSTDTHILRLTEFYDSIIGYNGVKATLGYSYKCNKKIFITANILYQYVKAEGKSGARVIGEKNEIIETENSSSAICDYCYGISFGVGCNLF